MTGPATAAPTSNRSDQRRDSTGVAVCVPARDEAATIGPIIAAVHASGAGDILVVDDGSTDRTAQVARRAGARVLSTPPLGKGHALRTAVASTASEVIVFIDADLASFQPDHIAMLSAPVLTDPDIMLVKPRYRRSLHGRDGEGGRVTELVARPLLHLGWPELAHLSQPLAGEYAVRRSAVEHVNLAEGYAVDLVLLIDIAEHHGPDAITEVDLGQRVHRNRPLHELTRQATEILSAAVARLSPPPERNHTSEEGDAR